MGWGNSMGKLHREGGIGSTGHHLVKAGEIAQTKMQSRGGQNPAHGPDSMKKFLLKCNHTHPMAALFYNGGVEWLQQRLYGLQKPKIYTT